MKIARYALDGAVEYGVLEEGRMRRARGNPYDGLKILDEVRDLSTLRLLSPSIPGKAVCIGLNYRDHAEEFGLPIPAAPVVFIKPSTTVINPGDLIEKPAMCSRLDYEAELVVVIGKKARHVSAEKAHDYILGYTCGNDVTARDLQPKDGQWTVAKSFDTFLPFGPWVETDMDSTSLRIQAFLNGERKQNSNTKNLIFPVRELVAYLSAIMTLEPGDIIMTGTPSGVGPMAPGDEIRIEIEGIGSLVNRVR